MNSQSIENARDADLRLSSQALQRSAQRARELAIQTGTVIVVSRQGIIETINPATGGQELAKATDSRGDTP